MTHTIKNIIIKFYKFRFLIKKTGNLNIKNFINFFVVLENARDLVEKFTRDFQEKGQI